MSENLAEDGFHPSSRVQRPGGSMLRRSGADLEAQHLTDTLWDLPLVYQPSVVPSVFICSFPADGFSPEAVHD